MRIPYGEHLAGDKGINLPDSQLDIETRRAFENLPELLFAAMGERAECVMLNKGPHIVDAMRTLDDILHRMQGHQTKKRPLLRALKSWGKRPSSA